MNLDFSALLALLTLLSGLICGGHRLYRRLSRAGRAQTENEPLPITENEPLLVEGARALFPVLVLVLIVRSFIVEPFRIPSGSMMPTLLIGDFILVNKYQYGLRLPVLGTKFVDQGTPKRGDIIVFRSPEDLAVAFIKRVVGLPGDTIGYRDKTLYINGQPTKQTIKGRYNAVGSGSMMDGASLRQETLGTVKHEILISTHISRSILAGELEITVPEGHYFVLGDNRDNSRDSRIWGFVADEHLIGKAFLIWMNWDRRNEGVETARIGMKID